MSRSFDCTSLRAVSIARSSCAPIDLQCTGRNQPSRINCAMPRASLRSLFTGIAAKALCTCRVSNSSTAKPAAFIAAEMDDLRAVDELQLGKRQDLVLVERGLEGEVEARGS